MKIESAPYDFPLNGGFEPQNCALMVIDMQIDFCAPDGYMDRMGVDLAPLRSPIDPISRVLAAMRDGGYSVIHTRETFRPDLSDVQPHRRYRGIHGTSLIPGDEGPLGRSLIQGEACWDIIPELAPLDGEAVFDKNAYGAFGSTNIHDDLRARGIANLVIAGVTTNCCIHSNLREALDRGYDCLVLEDCCGASSRESHERSMAMMRSDDGVFGAVATSDALIKALQSP
ncbi:MAG: isochorismatase family cysteine hydrolase [Alphaproteobacteria bacterium]|jgi:nicotinamidase-related amidase